MRNASSRHPRSLRRKIRLPHLLRQPQNKPEAFADFTVLRDGQTVELPDVQFDTWTDEAGQVHMSLGFTVYGLAKTPRNVLREAGIVEARREGKQIFYRLTDENACKLVGALGTIFCADAKLL